MDSGNAPSPFRVFWDPGLGSQRGGGKTHPGREGLGRGTVRATGGSVNPTVMGLNN